jgi:predicted Zn-dependent protease
MSSLDPKAPEGFNMSSRRVLLELGLLLGALGLGVWLALRAAGLLASWLTPLLSTELDISMGKALSQQQRFLGQSCDNPELTAYVEAIAERLTGKLQASPFSYQFSVVDSEQVNAFALPGGFITVNFGLIEQAESGEEIAAVLAHELQHVELRHGTRRILRQVSGFGAISLLFGDTSFQVPAYLMAKADFLSNGREQEAEADRLGLKLLVDAGIDPKGFASFFRRMQTSSLSPPEFLSTHPDPGNRVAAAEEQARRHAGAQKLPSPKALKCRAEAASAAPSGREERPAREGEVSTTP